MVLQVFPEPSTSSINAFSYVIPTALKQYKTTNNFSVGGYVITTSPSNQQVFVEFVNGTEVIGSTTTVSGTITFQLATAATEVYVTSATGSNTTVTITLATSTLTGAEISDLF